MMGYVEQLGFEHMPDRLYVCTPTRLATWLDCPRRYRMTYLDRPPPAKGPPWAHNSVGASVHNALAAWWRLSLAGRTVPAAGDLLERGWLESGFADDAQSAHHRERCRAMVENYVARLDPAAEPLGVERVVAMKTERIALSGRIDRLDEVSSRPGPAPPTPGRDDEGEVEPTARRAPSEGERGHDLVVVDYKTSRHVPAPDDVRSSVALALYAVAAARVLRRPARQVELHHLPTGQVLAWRHTAQALERQLRRAEDIAAECSKADTCHAAGERGDSPFPPRPGSACGWCDYRAHCPEGQDASAARRPWDGLAEAD